MDNTFQKILDDIKNTTKSANLLANDDAINQCHCSISSRINALYLNGIGIFFL